MSTFSSSFAPSKIALFLVALATMAGGLSSAVSSTPRGIEIGGNSLMDNISSGIKLAGKMLGVETSADVANLVAKAFSNSFQPTNRFQDRIQDGGGDGGHVIFEQQRRPPPPTYSSQPSLIGSIFRLMGLDGNKLGALAINGLIFLAQLIGGSLMTQKTQFRANDGRSPRLPDGFPIDWILDNPNQQLLALLAEVQDKDLSTKLIDMVETSESWPGEMDCLKLLVCKFEPFLWKMQKAVKHRIRRSVNEEELNQEINDPDRLKILFKHLPDKKEFEAHSKECEARFPNCRPEEKQPKSPQSTPQSRKERV